MGKYHGYAGNVVYINLTESQIKKEPFDLKLAEDLIGGSGFGHKLIYDLLTPGIDPLSPNNPIIITTGALSGSMVPSASQVQITSKFPINTVGSGYGGGSLGPMLKWAGYDYIVITGRAENPVYLEIIDGEVKICDARDLWGKDIAKTTIELWDKYGGNGGVLAIGPCGENLVTFALAKIDNLSMIGRGGFGSVMGSKNLKALVAFGKKGITVADEKRFLRAVAGARKHILSLPYREEWIKYGILMAWDMWEKIGFCSHNFSELYPKEMAKELFGKEAFDKVRKKTVGCLGCPVADKYLLQITEGEYAGLESLITHPIGHVLCWGIRAGGANNETAVMAHDYCDKQGMDEWVATGLIDFAIKLYEEGIITIGDTGGIELKRDFSTFMTLTEQIVKKEGFGVLLGSGYEAMIEKFGKKAKKYAVHIKGLDPVVDARGGALSLGLEQCINPRGVSAIPVSSPANVPGRKSASFRRYLANLGASEKAIERVCVDPPGINIGRLNRWVEDYYSVNNALGVCTRQPIYQCYVGDFLAELYSSLTGIEKSKEELLVCGERAWNLLKAVNVREGFGRKDDKFPEASFEPIATKEGEEFRMRDYYQKQYLMKEDIEKILDDYYDERGWNVEKGIPARKKLEELGLKYIADDLEKIGELY